MNEIDIYYEIKKLKRKGLLKHDHPYSVNCHKCHSSISVSANSIVVENLYGWAEVKLHNVVLCSSCARELLSRYNFSSTSQEEKNTQAPSLFLEYIPYVAVLLFVFGLILYFLPTTLWLLALIGYFLLFPFIQLPILGTLLCLSLYIIQRIYYKIIKYNYNKFIEYRKDKLIELTQININRLKYNLFKRKVKSNEIDHYSGNKDLIK